VNRGGRLLIVFPVDDPCPHDEERLRDSWDLLGAGPVSYGDLHQ
jgi:hypothetical protein